MNHGYAVYSTYMRCKLPMAEVGGPYIHGIQQVTMIHIVYMLIDAILAKWCICNGSGVYVTEVVY